jgi:hypothetical protein
MKVLPTCSSQGVSKRDPVDTMPRLSAAAQHLAEEGYPELGQALQDAWRELQG